MKPKTRYLIAIMNLSCAVTIGAIDLKAQHLAGKVHMIEEELSSWTANGEAMQGKLFGKSTYITTKGKTNRVVLLQRGRLAKLQKNLWLRRKRETD